LKFTMTMTMTVCSHDTTHTPIQTLLTLTDTNTLSAILAKAFRALSPLPPPPTLTLSLSPWLSARRRPPFVLWRVHPHDQIVPRHCADKNPQQQDDYRRHQAAVHFSQSGGEVGDEQRTSSLTGGVTGDDPENERGQSLGDDPVEGFSFSLARRGMESAECAR